MTSHVNESRDERIVRQCRETNEPYIIFRAKDILSLFALLEYERQIEHFQGDDHEFAEELAERIQEFKQWQRANPDKIKLPD